MKRRVLIGDVTLCWDVVEYGGEEMGGGEWSAYLAGGLGVDRDLGSWLDLVGRG